jgi:hypothetical protein
VPDRLGGRLGDFGGPNVQGLDSAGEDGASERYDTSSEGHESCRLHVDFVRGSEE